ncbi:hypothetical protein [Streptobacillus moniliformis]|uniref:hypothetical protein n=1 Tax=Streptobacillus moniliformis TaxID=34105 RepID=UPI000ADB058D|nr:hypothetical protein [Streptobacillus moniliformis]
MKNTKKILGVFLIFVMILSITTGCSPKNGNENAQKTKELTFVKVGILMEVSLSFKNL